MTKSGVSRTRTIIASAAISLTLGIAAVVPTVATTATTPNAHTNGIESTHVDQAAPRTSADPSAVLTRASLRDAPRSPIGQHPDTEPTRYMGKRIPP